MLPWLPKFVSLKLIAYSPEIYSSIFHSLISENQLHVMKLEDLGPLYITDAYMGTPQ